MNYNISPGLRIFAEKNRAYWLIGTIACLAELVPTPARWAVTNTADAVVISASVDGETVYRQRISVAGRFPETELISDDSTIRFPDE